MNRSLTQPPFDGLEAFTEIKFLPLIFSVGTTAIPAEDLIASGKFVPVKKKKAAGQARPKLQGCKSSVIAAA